MANLPHAWYVRGATGDAGLFTVTCYLSNDHPDGVVVAEPGDTSHYGVLWRVEPGERALAHVTLADFAAPGSPPMWFVAVDEPKASPRAMNLVAFATDHFAPGTIVSNYTFASIGVVSTAQAGAVRWYPRDGLIHQIYVGEQWRRQHVGTVLLYAASAFHQANGWAGRLHADGRRTDHGERFAAGSRHPARVTPITDVMPPMDPSPTE